MTSKANEILEAALKLSTDEQAYLIDALQERMQEPVHPAWGAEIERRVAELRSGAVRGVPWAEVQRHIEGIRRGDPRS